MLPIFIKNDSDSKMVISSNRSPALFWDVDVSKLDWNRHQQLIGERLIQRGSLNVIKEVIVIMELKNCEIF